MQAAAPVPLSKSKFVAGIQCLKRLYLQVHQPELAGEADDGQEARFEQGHEVGLLAQSRFPGGVAVSAEYGLDDALAKTTSLLNDPSVPAIFEATFRHSNVLVRVDILQRRPRGRWRLIEVKSSVRSKEQYLYDVAIQHHVLSACGLDLSSACLMHLNGDYIYDGVQHDAHELFTIASLTGQVRKLSASLPRLLRTQRSVLARVSAPEIESGPHCSDPYRCEFFSHCNAEPPENHISFLPRLSSKKAQGLFDLGVSLIGDIPDDFPLTEIQDRARTVVTTGRPWVSDALARELARLKYPLYFMDFESLYPAIPRFAGMWPYSQIPFQWSVHRQLTPDAELEHFEFLADTDQDPRPSFIDTLCAAVGTRGQIVTYNASFESQRLGELADWLPQYGDRIAKMQARLWDLLPFVRVHVYHPEFKGSFSLKTVLPALVPDLTYDGMEVSHGEEAGLAWNRMIGGGLDAEERARLTTALLAYCRQDTLAMVRVLEHLRSLPGRLTARGRG